MFSQGSISNAPPMILAASYLVLWALEGLDGPPASVRGRRVRNLLVSALAFIASGLTAALILTVAAEVARRHFGLLWLVSLPDVVRVAAGVLLIDLVDYWRHRISHSVLWLWRLHRLHHTDPAMDVTTALRSHPIEMLLRGVILASATLVLGIPLWSHLIYAVLSMPVLVLQHAAIRLPTALDDTLRWLVTTPGMHAVHHSRERAETDSNYATFLTLWDRLFGSYRGGAPVAVGLDGYDAPRFQTFVGMLATPWGTSVASRTRGQDAPGRVLS